MANYKHASFDNAIKLLRPGAKFTIAGTVFTRWEHQSSPPSIEEIDDMIKIVQEWEDSNPDLVDKVYI
jgi:hypothetical protein